MWNQERTREMGMFLSMGFSKGKIMGKLITENLLEFSGTVLKAGNVMAVGLGGLVFCAAVTALSSVKIMRVNPKEILTMTS